MACGGTGNTCIESPGDHEVFSRCEECNGSGFNKQLLCTGDRRFVESLDEIHRAEKWAGFHTHYTWASHRWKNALLVVKTEFGTVNTCSLTAPHRCIALVLAFQSIESMKETATPKALEILRIERERRQQGYYLVKNGELSRRPS